MRWEGIFNLCLKRLSIVSLLWQKSCYILLHAYSISSFRHGYSAVAFDEFHALFHP